MTLVPSLLQAIIRLDGEAVVMHVGDRPYVVTPNGQVDLATRGLTFEAVTGIVNQLLPTDSQHALDEFGAAQYELPSMSEFPGESFTIVAARGGDDVWAEIRRRQITDDDHLGHVFGSVATTAACEREAPGVHAGQTAAPPTIVAAQGGVHAEPGIDDDLGLPDATHLWPDSGAVSVDNAGAPDDTLTIPTAALSIRQMTSSIAVRVSALAERPGDSQRFAPAEEDDGLGLPDVDQLWPGMQRPATTEEPWPSAWEAAAPAVGKPPFTDLPAQPMNQAPDHVISSAQSRVHLSERLNQIEYPTLGDTSTPVHVSQALLPAVSVAIIETASTAVVEEVAEPIAGLFVEAAVAIDPQPPAAEPAAVPVMSAPEIPMTAGEMPVATESASADASESAPAARQIPMPAGVSALPVQAEEPAVQPRQQTESASVPTSGQPAATAPTWQPPIAPPVRESVPAGENVATVEPSAGPVWPPPTTVREPIAAQAWPAAPAHRPQSGKPPVLENAATPVLPLTRNAIRPDVPRLAEQSLSNLDQLLRLAAARGASMLYLSSASRPSVRVDGEIYTLDGAPVLGPNDVESLLLTLMPERNAEALRTGVASEWICDLPEVGRVRCLSFRDHRGPGGVFRMMPVRAITAEQLGLTHEIQALAMEPEGLVLVAGPRASGKRTLISAFVDLINRTRRDHIISVESEINVVHERNGSLISQREIRGGAEEMYAAARGALREDPDVLVLEEVRTGALMNLALEAAASGHLVIGGFPAHNATGAVDRIIDLYPPEYRRQVQLSLAQNLRGVVSQVLLRKRGGGRLAAREVLLNTPAVSSVLAEGRTSQLPLAIEGGRKTGMMPLNDALVGYVQSGAVEVQEAYRRSADRGGFLELLKRQGVDTSAVERFA
jgi:twitching motility protein PilT